MLTAVTTVPHVPVQVRLNIWDINHLSAPSPQLPVPAGMGGTLAVGPGTRAGARGGQLTGVGQALSAGGAMRGRSGG